MRSQSSKVVSERDPASIELASEVLLKGELVVAPTDTIYGILADATNPEAVNRLRTLRRPSGRPFIVLVPDLPWAGKLGLELKKEHIKLLSLFGVTVVLRKRTGLYHWLGKETLAVRVPRRGFVHRLLKYLGRPVVAPSANPEGKPPAMTVGEAVKYFGNKVSLYVDGGRIGGKPSALVDGKTLKVLRGGPYSFDSLNRLFLTFSSGLRASG